MRPHQVLGLSGILCSPALLAAFLMGGFDNPNPSRGVVVAQLLFLVGWLCSVLALIRMSAAGRRRGRVLLWVQLAGVILASTQEVQDLLLAPSDRITVLYNVADATWPFSVILMIAAGTAVVRAGVLDGWRRFTVLACGTTLPLSIAAAGLLGPNAMGPMFGALTTAAWGALGWAIVSQSRTTLSTGTTRARDRTSARAD